jgi:hypothetical protein
MTIILFSILTVKKSNATTIDFVQAIIIILFSNPMVKKSNATTVDLPGKLSLSYSLEGVFFFFLY